MFIVDVKGVSVGSKFKWTFSSCLVFLVSNMHFSQSKDTDKSFRNFIKSNQNQIILTIFQLIWIETNVYLVPNQSENGKYNLISVWFKNTSKRFLCVCTKYRSFGRGRFTPQTNLLFLHYNCRGVGGGGGKSFVSCAWGKSSRRHCVKEIWIG